MGPVVCQAQLESDLAYVELAMQEGGRLAAGGGVLGRPHKGYYMAPTVFVETKLCMRVNQDERSCLIACVIQVATSTRRLRSLTPRLRPHRRHRDALARARGQVPAGLSSGCVMVNLPTAGTDYHVPFGGLRGSSYGPREQGPAAVEFYTQMKTSYIHAGTPE